MYFLYMLGSNLTIHSAVVYYSIICTMLFMSVWRKVPDMSVIATSLLSFASIVHHNIKASNKLAGKTVFSCVVN